MSADGMVDLDKLDVVMRSNIIDYLHRVPFLKEVRGSSTGGSDTTILHCMYYRQMPDMTTQKTFVHQIMYASYWFVYYQVPANKLILLGEMATYEVKRQGQAICREGEEGQEIFIVLDGKAKVVTEDRTRSDESGKFVTTELAELGPGDYFGELVSKQ